MTARKSQAYKPRPAGTLKQAEDSLIKAVGVDRAADLLGRSRTQVYRITDPAEAGAHLGADDIRALEREIGDPIVTAFLAAEAGQVLMALAGDDADGDVPRAVAAFSQRSAALYAGWAESLANDGELDGEEAGELVAMVDRNMGALARLRAELVAKQRGGQ